MTLPTRDDGGIDWDRIIFPTEKAPRATKYSADEVV